MEATEYTNDPSIISLGSNVMQTCVFVQKTDTEAEHFVLSQSNDNGQTWKEVGKLYGPFKMQLLPHPPKMKYF